LGPKALHRLASEVFIIIMDLHLGCSEVAAQDGGNMEADMMVHIKAMDTRMALVKRIE